MQGSKTRYTWADAWFLLSVSYVSPNGEPAGLSAVIGAADYINHAILTHAEITSATSKFTEDQWVRFEDGCFVATEKMQDQFADLPSKSAMSQLEIVESWLDAESFSGDYDPNLETGTPFPEITEAMVDEAVSEYKK